jgi:hypothetical protein
MAGRSSVVDQAPPEAPPSGGGGGGWAWLVTARGIVEAQLINGILEANGIAPVVLDTSDPSPGAWLFLSGNVNALVRILVPASLLDSARLALLEAGLEADVPAASTPVKPSKDSGGMMWLVAITLIVLAAFLINVFRDVLM